MTVRTENETNVETVDQFKSLLYTMQDVRRRIVHDLIHGKDILPESLNMMAETLVTLTDAHTVEYQRSMATANDTFTVNIRDEIIGLKKDLDFLSRLMLENGSSEERADSVDLGAVLAPFHPISEEKFFEELEAAESFLMDFVASEAENNRKPLFITDWDGTMKDYCSQYATNLQPIYSAFYLARFARKFTRLAAVLTAGPLRGPGILDLTALPIDGPVLFSGSWGREWWLNGKRVVLDDGISEEGFDALERLSDEMITLLQSGGEYSQFALVGSGVQRKVDRLTLGVQTVCGHVSKELSERYQDEVKERMHRVDPYNQILVFDPSTELEVEVCIHSSGTVWNKADGVASVVQTKGDSLKPPGRVLICGDTASDLPMVRQAKLENPEGVMALFVGQNEKLRLAVASEVGDPKRVCFISSPDVFHAAVSRILAVKQELD